MPSQTVTRAAARPIGNVEACAEKYIEEHAASPEDAALTDGEPLHEASLTAVAAEAMRTGLHPQSRDEEVPGQDDLLRAGDPDVDPLENLYSGEELPGGSTPSPDQNNVDELGRAAGLTMEGELRAAEEIVDRRDRHRWDNEPLSPKI